MTPPIFLEEALCLIVSDLMELIPITDEHFFKRKEANIQSDKLKDIGWFNKHIDPLISGFWEFVTIVRKKGDPEPKDDEPPIKRGPVFPGCLPTY